jgi:hypothetical protein
MVTSVLIDGLIFWNRVLRANAASTLGCNISVLYGRRSARRHDLP